MVPTFGWTDSVYTKIICVFFGLTPGLHKKSRAPARHTEHPGICGGQKLVDGLCVAIFLELDGDPWRINMAHDSILYAIKWKAESAWSILYFLCVCNSVHIYIYIYSDHKLSLDEPCVDAEISAKLISRDRISLWVFKFITSFKK